MDTLDRQNDATNQDAFWDDMTQGDLQADDRVQTVTTKTKKKPQKPDPIKAAGDAALKDSSDAARGARGSTLGESIWDTITNPNQAAKNIAEVGKDTAKAAQQAAKDIAAATKKTLTEGAKRTEKILLLVAVIAFFVAQSKS